MSEKEPEKQNEEVPQEESKPKELTIEERRKVQEILIKAKHAFEKSNFGFSVELYAMVLKIDPDNEEASHMFFPSTVAFRQSKGKNPLIDVIGFIQNIPVYIKWLIKKAQKKHEDTLYALLEITKKEAKNFFVFKQLGNVALDLHLTNLAIHAFERFLSIRQEDVPVLKILGQIYMDIDNREKAKEIFKRIIQKSPFDSEANKGLKDISAKTTIEKSKWDDEQDYRTKIRDEDEAEMAEIGSHLAQSQKEILLLIEKNEKSLEQNPQDIRTLRTLSELYRKINRFDKSLGYYKTLAALQPGDADLALSVVKMEYSIFENEKKSPQELTDFLLGEYQRLCNQYPTNHKLRYEFGTALLESRKYDEAIAEFQKSVASPNFKAESINKLGICFESKNFYDLAIDEYKRGMNIIGEDMNELKKEMTYNLARTLEKLKKPEEALLYYKKIYQVDISYRDVAKKIEQFHSKDKGSTSTTT
ncbi:MAG: tetratricopeptide repeat protein [Candidatus Aureabacteria bacterium]|nr:tetratricopeptide repeat protein [Candidatus Auribacterota bacterium]